MSRPPLPSPPFFTVPNINNLRDASYSLTSSASSTPLRSNILFRSADVSKLLPPNWSTLHSIGIRHVFDLRSAPEVLKGFSGIVDGSASDLSADWMQWMRDAGIERSWVPVFKEKDYSPERLAERYVKYMDEDVMGFVGAYREILRDAGDAYRSILLYLINQDISEEVKGVLVHCTAGKDRTGMFFGILFRFLGVSREKIAEEYHLTERGLEHVRDEVVQRLMQSPGFKKYIAAQMDGRALSSEEVAKGLRNGDADGLGEAGDGKVIPPEVLEKGRQAAIRMVGARRETMLRSLEMVDEEFGGAEKYLREYCKLTDGDLEKLRKNLLVER